MIEYFDSLKNNLHLDQISMAELSTPLTIEFYEKWLKNKYHGQMDYLAKHFSIKKNPQLIEPRLNSAITIAQSYYPAPNPTFQRYPARIALYAQNKDYHFWLKDKLLHIIEELKKKFPNEIFLAYVDSGPILERDLAQKSGLGWFGKNTCLIHPQRGSLFFIAEILTSLKMSSLNSHVIEPIADFCGTCTRCIDICPTHAIKESRNLKADECISYLTIESKTVPPLKLRHQINDWFFGCDLCQTICPWNQKVFRQKKIPVSNDITTEPFQTLATHTEQIDFFRLILKSSNRQIQKQFFGTALYRAGGFGLKRNALVVIGNKKILELKAEVQHLLKDPKLSELAKWCIEQIT